MQVIHGPRGPDFEEGFWSSLGSFSGVGGGSLEVGDLGAGGAFPNSWSKGSFGYASSLAELGSFFRGRGRGDAVMEQMRVARKVRVKKVRILAGHSVQRGNLSKGRVQSR